MQQTISLGIDNPCSESWDRMSPNGQGRFCGSCQKTVVDFTLMTDQQLMQWFTRRQGPVCGRFAQDQLQRPLAVSRERKTPWRFWQYLIAGLLFSSDASAQLKPDNPPTARYDHREARTSTGAAAMVQPDLAPPDSARGRVVDANGKPVYNATIMFGPKHGVIADADGRFTIPMNKLSPHQVLTISAVGYTTITLNVDQLLAAGPLQLFQVVMPGEVVIAGGVFVTRVRRKRPKVVADTISLFKDTLASAGLARPALIAYPNPVARGALLTLTARLDQPGNYRVQLYNMSGALIESQELPAVPTAGATTTAGAVSTKLSASAKSRSIALPIPAGLAPGTYFVRLSHPALSKCYTQQIVVF
ncbi:MAG TPA: carboxypeptidase regulatory-like domain-containing protein [Puia sp.]|nr:carboxypeptidase regulatory-like domain-containing protein [Puia sp.]